MNVSACLVTKGNVQMGPVLDSLPDEWEKIVWFNSHGKGRPGLVGRATWTEETDWGFHPITAVDDLSVYGRYAAIQYATNDLIFVCDDDVIVSDPQAIVDYWERLRVWAGTDNAKDHSEDPDQIDQVALGHHVAANMPQEFRVHYPDACLVGFGSVFHRDAPARAFSRFFGTDERGGNYARDLLLFYRECDRVFTVLTPRVLVDVPKEDREMASDPDRLWRDPEHHSKTKRILELARAARDA